jgi:hypothetical protein
LEARFADFIGKTVATGTSSRSTGSTGWPSALAKIATLVSVVSVVEVAAGPFAGRACAAIEIATAVIRFSIHVS